MRRDASGTRLYRSDPGPLVRHPARTLCGHGLKKSERQELSDEDRTMTLPLMVDPSTLSPISDAGIASIEATLTERGSSSLG